MKQTKTSNKSRGALGIIALVLIGSFVIPLVVMNLTPGHVGFPDNVGCACFVAYTTSPSLPACEGTRPLHCDGLWIQQLLAHLSRFDLTQ
ncbi:MAG: hypothetical protein GTN93_10315 [Anaerolineae bacterium]|nr:hypothetical protein [Anaerolineae bacterium]